MVNPRDIAGNAEEEEGEPQRYSWGTQKKKKNGEPQRYSWERRRRRRGSLLLAMLTVQADIAYRDSLGHVPDHLKQFGVKREGT